MSSVCQVTFSWNNTQTQNLTKNDSLNSNEQGNCLVSWWTQSNHWRNTGHLWFSSWLCPWPHLSAKRWPNSNHSRVTNTWNPWQGKHYNSLGKLKIILWKFINYYKIQLHQLFSCVLDSWKEKLLSNRTTTVRSIVCSLHHLYSSDCISDLNGLAFRIAFIGNTL